MTIFESLISQIKKNNYWEFWIYFPQKLIKHLKISQEEKKFLVEQGLPKFVAPHLYFGNFDHFFLPKLKDWTWNEKKIVYVGDAIDLEVIGIAPNDDPICINKNGNVIIVMEDSTFQYMNSSLLIMLQTLIYYSEYMDIALEKEENPILLKSFVKKMQEKINSIDSKALESSSFWSNEINNIIKNL